ncbi:1373_t:CDS:2 [Funneliformis mosseae]|uniref:1373_t:CDS:1 n=1 Tax=Funneliformis mosseae TaxID=27381 RepID=A0A9N8ZH73_FUNMO|nr:1373_t:CDS:2 [Funneliformis mosseae]
MFTDTTNSRLATSKSYQRDYRELDPNKPGKLDPDQVRVNIFKNVSNVEISRKEHHSKERKRKKINYCYSDTEDNMTDSSDDQKENNKVISKKYESHHMNQDVNGQVISSNLQLENVNVKIELKEIDHPPHLNEKNTSEELRCAVSDFNKTFNEQNYLITPTTHINDNQFNCDEPGCGKRFSISSYLKIHQNLQHHMSQMGTIDYVEKVKEQQPIDDVKVIKCTLSGCNKTFKDQKNLKRHLELHKGEKPFICDEPGCGKRFALRDYVKTHQKRQHEMKRRQNESNKHHQQSKKDNKEVKCPNPGCDQILSKRFLDKHLKIHESEMPYVCNKPGCGKRFTIPDYLKIHQKIHNNLIYASNLANYPTEEVHIVIEDRGQKDDFVLMAIRCTVPGCNRKFQKEKSLKKHLKIHNDEKRFSEGLHMITKDVPLISLIGASHV